MTILTRAKRKNAAAPIFGYNTRVERLLDEGHVFAQKKCANVMLWECYDTEMWISRKSSTVGRTRCGLRQKTAPNY